MNDDMLELSMWRDGNIMHENCIEDMNKLKEERDEARRQVCKDAGILRSVYVDPDQDINEWANYIAKIKGWDCFKEENKNG